MWAVARRPRWVGALIFALLLSAGFAALGQWQLGRAIASGTVVERTTETVMPLEQVATPQQPLTEAAIGQLVSVEGSYVADEWSILSGRSDGEREGFWVVGHLVTEPVSTNSDSAPADLAVALGWAATEADAAAVVDTLEPGQVAVSGRLLLGDSPQQTDFENGEQSALAPAALVNEWAEVTGQVYGGYIVSSEPADGLQPIAAPAPEETAQLNWLNVFYAVEWVVFAGFAIFMWYRLVRDAWERELDEAAEAALAA